MKKLITQFLMAIALLLSVNTNAQTWSSPVLVETLNGIGGDAGQFSSLCIVNGNPAISYYNVTHTSLMFVRSTDASGTSWGMPVQVDITGDVGQYTSLQIVNGNPAISYYDYTNHDLKYVRANDVSGSSWGTPASVDVTGDVGQYTSLQVVNGNPAISYFDNTNYDLKYVRATDAMGTTWGTPQVIDVTSGCGPYNSMQIVNGVPAISYSGGYHNGLKYVRAADALGTVWNTPLTIDLAGYDVYYTSLQIVNGNPAISYFDVPNQDLKYVRATDASGTIWATSITLDATGSTGANSSLQIVNGNPAISYFQSGGGLKYIRSIDVSGTSWNTPILIGSNLDQSQYTSLQIVNGIPAVSYYYYNSGNGFLLRYMRATDASGTTWSAPVSIQNTGDVGDYSSLQIVNGNPAISYKSNNGDGLKYVRATNASGSAWSASVSVDQTAGGSRSTSLQIVNGNPAISYCNFSGNGLKYVRATDASGTAWAAPVSIDVTGIYVDYTSLQIVNGNPAISYYDQTNGHLKYVRATDASGTVWDAPITIDATANVGAYTSLRIVNGNPAISYSDLGALRLKYIRATDATGSAWAAPITVDATYGGSSTSLQIVNGNPAIAYYNIGTTDLKYVRATDASGTVWASPVAIDVTGSVGRYASLQVVNGYPAISYQNVTTADLKYVSATDVSGTAWDAPVTLDAPGSTGFYSSMIPIGSNVGISYYNQTEKFPYFILGAFPPVVYIPDVNFKAALVADLTINTNSDAEIQVSEAAAYTGVIAVQSSNISDLTGIEAFTAIIYLDCDYNSLSSLDVSHNTALAYLDCSGNSISSLDLSQNAALNHLVCEHNSLSTLDISNNAALDYLNCNSNFLTSIDVSFNTALTHLECYSNSITTLDMSQNAILNTLVCFTNSLSSLNVANGNNTSLGIFASQNPSLTCIQVDNVAWSTANWTVGGGNIDNTASFSLNCNCISPIADAGVDRPICLGQNTIIGAAPVAGNTYSWNNAGSLNDATLSNPTATPAVTTTYTVTASVTATGCTSTDAVIATVNPLPTADAGSDQAMCVGQVVTIGTNAVAGNTYSWDNAGTLDDATLSNPTATPAITTTYTVTVTTTATGCTSTDAVTVTVNPLPNADAGIDQSECVGQGVTIGNTAVVGNTYLWDNAGSLNDATLSNPTATPAVTTTYTITASVTATGCTSIDAVTVTVNPLPVADAGIDQAVCVGQGVIIGNTAVAGNTYSWDNVASLNDATLSNPTSAPAVTTTYTVTASVTATGCISTDAVTVTVNPLPTADAGVDQTICAGGVTTVGSSSVAGNTYLWSPITGLSNPSASNPFAFPASTTTYTVTVTTTATGCTSTDAVIVTVNPLPTADAGVDQTVCAGQGVTIGTSAVGGNTYSWDNAGTLNDAASSNPTGTPASNTTYTVTVTVTATGCTATDAVSVTVHPLPLADAGTDQTLCQGGIVQIGSAVVGGNSYSWSPSTSLSDPLVSNPTANPSSTTTYTVTVTTTATGCTSTDTVAVTVNPLPVADAGFDQTICVGQSIGIGAAAVGGNSYSWSPSANLTSSMVSNPTANPVSTTTYTVTVTTTATGCTNTEAAVVNVNPVPTANAGIDQSYCTGGSTVIGSGSVGGNTYSWSPSVNLTSSIVPNPTANPTSTTTYTVTATTTATGCSASDAMVLTVNPLPTVTFDPIPTVCRNYQLTLTGGSPVGGVYSGAGVSGGVFNAASTTVGPHTITYTYTDGNGCINSANQTVVVDAITCTELNSAYCNITLTTLNDHLYFDWVSGATNYEINATNVALGYNQSYIVGAATVFRMTNFPGIAYGTVYDVKVRPMVGGVWGSFGSVCTITTSPAPITQLATAYCGISLASMSDNLYFNWIDYATNYDINVVNSSLGYNQTITVGATTVFRMTNFTGIAFGTTYDVKVRAKINGVYGPFGSICTVTTPIGPITELATISCNTTLVAMTNNLYYDYISGASNYDVNVVNAGLGYNQTVTKGSTTNFRMTNFTGLLASTTYDVKVRAKINGVYCPWGSVCTVTTPITLSRNSDPDSPSTGSGIGSVSKLVELSAYPNPFSEILNILFTSDETSAAQLNIYDITGRKIYTYENFPVNISTELQTSQMFQSSLASGIYFVEVLQGDKRKIIKVVRSNE